MMKNLHVKEVIITRYEVDYKLSPRPHFSLMIKCFCKEDERSFKFYLPTGEKRIQAFMITTHALDSLNSLFEKKFQVLTLGDDKIIGISQIGEMERVLYIPCVPADETLDDAPLNRMMNFQALMSLVTEFSKQDKQYYVKIE